MPEAIDAIFQNFGLPLILFVVLSVDDFGKPRVDAFIFAAGDQGQHAVKRRTDAHNSSAFGRLFRSFLFPGAIIKISVNGFFKGLPDFLCGIGMKRYGMLYVGNTADKTFVFFAVFNLGKIAFIGHGGVHRFLSPGVPGRHAFP